MTFMATITRPLVPRRKLTDWERFSWWRLLAFLLLLSISILFVVPALWMLSTSLKAPQDLMNANWIPARLEFRNYKDAFSFGDWPRWTLNSLTISISGTIGMVLSTSLVGYSFARLRWPGRDWVFGLVLATMMLPNVVTMIPQFIVFSKLPAYGFQGSEVWVNTFLPLTVPAWLANSGFNVFLMRQFMRSIPMELSEAAKIDGASELRIWWSVAIPLSRPVLATIAIFTFQGAWQDFMGPLLYLQDESKYTLQLALRQFEHAAGGQPAWNQLMAVSLIVMLPVLIIFLVFQRYFMEGINLTGLGGR
jgi:ABC-type glycerol-3-phosphate transport system permease component